MSREWKPGEVAMVNDCTNPDAPWKPATCKEAARPGQCETVWILHDTGAKVWGSVSEARPLVVIDPEDREAVERLLTLFKWPGEVPQYVIDDMADALREFADLKPPKPYREQPGDRIAPWPVVRECFSDHVEGHECPQCAWEHEHDWVAWVHPQGSSWALNAVPIRCSKCGGRKCDLDACPEQRHRHAHDEGVQP